MKVRKRIAWMSCVLLLSFTLLTGCGSKALAEGFNEDTIIETAEQILNEIHVNGVADTLPGWLRENYTYENSDEYPVEEMDGQVRSLLSDKGELVGYTQESVIGKKSPDGTEDFGVILVTATYDNGEINFTLTFDKDMKLVSFYAK